MSKNKFVVDKAGVREMLLSDEMQAVVDEYGSAALQRLGPGYSMNSRKGKNRVNCEVTADTVKAARENLKNNTLLKAVSGK